MLWLALLLLMSKRGPDYEGAVQDQQQENINQLSDEIRRGSDRLMKRVRYYSEKYGYEENKVMNKLKEDRMFAAFFAKDPGRQRIHEKVAEKWISLLEKEGLLSDFKRLSQSGPEARYVSADGNIVTISKGDNKPSKALDFYWKTGKKDCYATHKYTGNPGGAQDNQREDVIQTVKNFTSCRQEHIALFAVLDGSYYSGKRMKEIRRYQRLENPPYCYIIHSYELPPILLQLKQP